MVYYLLGFMLPELKFLVFLLQEFLGFPPLLGPLLQQGLQAGFLLPSSAKLLPGCLQLSSQDLYLLLELTLLLLTAPLEDRAGGTVGWGYLKGQNDSVKKSDLKCLRTKWTKCNLLRYRQCVRHSLKSQNCCPMQMLLLWINAVNIIKTDSIASVSKPA